MNIILPVAKTIFTGQSYWKVLLTSGKEVSELGTKVEHTMHPRTGKIVARRRKIEWLEDLTATGDVAHIKELILCTPQGHAHLLVSEPYTAFQLHRGFSSLFGSERFTTAQIIGRVDNKETGDCTAVIWDGLEQKLYIDHKTTVLGFKRWREGVTDVGAISLEVVGVRLS